MRKTKLEHFKKKLLKRHKEIIANYVKNKGNSQEDVRNGTEDYIDYAVSSYAKEFMLSLTEIDRKQLVLVEDALRRIKNKNYGKCQQCNQDISLKRLEAAPWARHCVKCQELEEQGLIPEYSYQKEEEELELDEVIPDEEEGEDEEEFEEGIKKYPARKRQENNETDEQIGDKTHEEE